MGLVYENTSYNSIFQENQQLNYVRPPYGMKFRVKNEKQNDFTVVFGHFDSPGRKAKAGEVSAKGFSGQGNYEIEEALNLINVMNWYDQKDGNNNDLIFMGDTNIKKKNGNKAFKNLLNSGYTSAMDMEELTSLGRTNLWSEPYDKMFIKSDLTSMNGQKFDIYSIFSHIEDEIKWKEEVNAQSKANKTKEIEENASLNEWVKKVSDHTFTFLELNVSNQDNDE
ncbi:hypothetical protein QEG99_00145 [Mesomycoplasma lagogenitalium]|uniref:Membrane nuclease MnuA n=2 Tax=Mesomycoplasma lagogenitalium TaxID=171286 RepID=A0ABY8LTW8_9BACT|nr:hypothetical protein [Mesomycoplasma lagogenitalium]WGI36685.1 hypothetical protein QEG99_00145 [Mesomycoplasma lagogenitalium]